MNKFTVNCKRKYANEEFCGGLGTEKKIIIFDGKDCWNFDETIRKKLINYFSEKIEKNLELPQKNCEVMLKQYWRKTEI